jgi:hypothetical protein
MVALVTDLMVLSLLGCLARIILKLTEDKTDDLPKDYSSYVEFKTLYHKR